MSTYQSLNPDAIIVHPVVKRPIPNANDQYYEQLPLSYLQDELIFEGCPVTSPFGLQEQRTGGPDNVKFTYSIYCKFNLSTESDCKFIDTMMTIYNKCALNIDDNKRTLKMHHFSSKHAEQTGFTNPLYYPTDRNTGARIVGRNPSIYWKLNQKDEQTIFYDNNNKFVPWHTLEYMEMKIIPTIHIKCVFIGYGRASLQIDLVSAKIVEMRPCNSLSKQLDQSYNIIVRYSNYNTNHLIADPVHSIYQDKKEYHRVPLMYNYGTVDQPVHDIFLLEGPEVDAVINNNNEMISKIDPSNQKVTHEMITYCEMTCKIDPKDQSVIHELITFCKDILKQNKGRFQIRNLEYAMKDPIRKNLLKVFISEDPRKPTLFTDRDGMTIERDQMVNKKFRCVPLFHVKDLKVQDGQGQLRIELHSAIVIEFS